MNDRFAHASKRLKIAIRKAAHDTDKRLADKKRSMMARAGESKRRKPKS